MEEVVQLRPHATTSEFYKLVKKNFTDKKKYDDRFGFPYHCVDKDLIYTNFTTETEPKSITYEYNFYTRIVLRPVPTQKIIWRAASFYVLTLTQVKEIQVNLNRIHREIARNNHITSATRFRPE
jgi:hypothetical protein